MRAVALPGPDPRRNSASACRPDRGRRRSSVIGRGGPFCRRCDRSETSVARESPKRSVRQATQVWPEPDEATSRIAAGSPPAEDVRVAPKCHPRGGSAAPPRADRGGTRAPRLRWGSAFNRRADDGAQTREQKMSEVVSELARLDVGVEAALRQRYPALDADSAGR